MLSESAIAAAKRATRYSDEDQLHEHDDCIRMAYEWLDAQTKTRTGTRKRFVIKHLIERWAGRYVSQSDVEAHMHPDIRGIYPYYNISARLTEPNIRWLDGMREANSQNYREHHQPNDYAKKEP